MREPSASNLALAKLCAHPFTSGIKWPWEERTDAADYGVRVHEACESIVTGAYSRPAVYRGLTPEQTTELERCVEHARVEVERLTQDRGCGVDILTAAELSMRYHVDSGRARLASSRSEPKRPGEWTTIADLVVVDLVAGVVVVVDWKTGRQQYTADAHANPQLRLAAVTAARIYGVKRVIVELIYLDQDGAHVDRAVFDRLDLATIAAEMRALRRSLTGGPTPPVPGAHCTQHWCKLVGVCSATQAALATASLGPGERFSVVIRDDEHARWSLERLPGAKAALEATERALKEHARAHPVPLADGKIYGWRETTKRVVDVNTPEREAALRGVLGAFADVAIEHKVTVSLEAIKEAARQAAAAAEEKRGGLARRTKLALDALEATGGLRVVPYQQCETFRPKEEAAEA